MRLVSLPLPTLLSGLVAVLVGYASSAALIWQAALATGATAEEIAGWMTALGIAMGISTLVLTLWYRAPVLTAWSTPGAALLVTGLQGVSLPDAVGIFIVANALIVLCGVTGLFARLMRIIPHSLAAAMLAGILLRFGLQAFGTLNEEFLISGSMLLAWLLFKVSAPRLCRDCRHAGRNTDGVYSGKINCERRSFRPCAACLCGSPIFHLLTV
ncbi:benzoate membrane transport protein [Salmonella bongori]|nr:benzoate membrane transport protein [Salmonella bongori]